MKRFSRSLLVVIAASGLLSVSGLAQTSGTSTGAGSSSSAAKPLSTGDRKVVKDTAEQILAVSHLAEITRHNGPGSEDLKKLNAKLKTDLDKIWGELGTVAQAHKAELPGTEVTGNEKTLLGKLRKSGKDESVDKFEKAFLKALDKETKKAAQVFEAADKAAQEPELKTVISTWAPKIKAYADEVTAAEAEAAKRK